MTSLQISTEPPQNKRGNTGKALAGEITTPQERQHCLSRVSGALRLLYALGEKTGSAKIRGAALDAMNATRGLSQ